MSAETTLHAALSALGPVTDLVDDKIRPVALREGDEYPAIAYRRDSTDYTNTIGNAAVASRVIFEIVCLDTTFDGAEAVCDAVEAVELEKLDRRSEYDADTKAFGAVLTVAVWT